MSINSYRDIIKNKKDVFENCGLSKIPELNKLLMPHQKFTVEKLLTQGRGAGFLDTGLGKTFTQLEVGRVLNEYENKPYLILTTLGVAKQSERESQKFGIDAKKIESDNDIYNGINICNYERLDKLDLTRFCGVGLDESSILKSFNGTTKKKLIDAFKNTKYKHCYTATPAPNDYMELGNHSEFLGILSATNMLTRFFTHDSGETSKWRIKKHAQNQFWDWVTSWGLCISRPSDLGFKDDGYDLPKLHMQEHIIDAEIKAQDGELFYIPEMSATSINQEKRASLKDRVSKLAEMVNSDNDYWIVWCDTNEESKMLSDAIPDAIEVRGSESINSKESKLEAFSTGKERVIITKSKIAGFGMNWQHCNKMGSVGINYSYESLYQRTRRIWRFGQERECYHHVMIGSAEKKIWNSLNRKMKDHDNMKKQMVEATKRAFNLTVEENKEYNANKKGSLPSWLI